jgi:hypothetical protein
MLGCTSLQYPAGILQDVDDRAVSIRRTDALHNLFQESGGSEIWLKVAEVKLNDGTRERRAFIDISGGQPVYLGKLNKVDPELPLEFLMFELKGGYFVVVWVQEDAAKEPLVVDIGRAPQGTENNYPQLRGSSVINRVALIPLPPREVPLWDALVTVRVSAKDVDTGYALHRDFTPPLRITHLFTQIEVP